MKLAYLDTETTGTDSFGDGYGRAHEVWEIGVVVVDGPNVVEALWRWCPDMTSADPTSLRLIAAHERLAATENLPAYSDGNASPVAFWISSGGEPIAMDGPPNGFVSYQQAAQRVAWVLAGAHVFGCVPSFDANFVNIWLRRHNLAPAWHHQLHDVEDVAAGKLGLQVPYDSDQISKELGLDTPDSYGRHTALGDARWARDVHEAALRAEKVEPAKRTRRQRQPVAESAAEVSSVPDQALPGDESVGAANATAPEPASGPIQSGAEEMAMEMDPEEAISLAAEVAEALSPEFVDPEDDEVARMEAALAEAQRKRDARVAALEAKAAAEGALVEPFVQEAVASAGVGAGESRPTLPAGMPAADGTHECFECGEAVEGPQAQLSWIKTGGSSGGKILCRQDQVAWAS